MAPVWLIDLLFGATCGAVGLAGGCWLVARAQWGTAKQSTTETKRLTQEALQGLQAAVETVQSCVAQHSECLSAIGASLTHGDASEAAASIIQASRLAEHQFQELREDLDARADHAREELGTSGSLLLTSLTLDRQKHTYQRVLASLESLAVEMSGELDGCGRKLQDVSQGLQATQQTSATEARLAISNLLDAVGDLGRSADEAEVRLESSATKVDMQAILSHADLLTSLPNRRALEDQLSREAGANGRKPSPCSLLLVDLDHFGSVNDQYGYDGGDEVLRQAATLVKRASRGRDTAARYGGDCFALTLSGTTLSQAMPVAERLRAELSAAHFSEGGRQLSLTGSIGLVQLQQGESPSAAIARAVMATKEAAAAGGNVCYYNDGHQCFPISAAHQGRQLPSRRSEASQFPANASLTGGSSPKPQAPQPTAEPEPTLCGRSIFVSNLKNRLAECNRGGPMVSVLLMRVDQVQELFDRHDTQAMGFLRRVMGRLLEAATRDMDQRCDYDEGVFAVLLPGVDEQGALAIADRLRSQVLNCKLRLNKELWDLSASIGVADASSGGSAVDVLVAAAAGMERAVSDGGDGVYAHCQVKAIEGRDEGW